MKKKIWVFAVCTLCTLALLTGCASSAGTGQESSSSVSSEEQDNGNTPRILKKITKSIKEVQEELAEPTPTPKKKKRKKKKKKPWIAVQVEFYNSISTIFTEMPEIGDLYLDGVPLDYACRDLEGNERDDYMSAYTRVTKGYHELELTVDGFDPLCVEFLVDESTMYDGYGDATKGRKKSRAAEYYFNCTLKRFGKKIVLEQKETEDYEDDEDYDDYDE